MAIVVVHVTQHSPALIPAIGAACAALAALASAISVHLTRRSQQEAQTPQLAFRVVKEDSNAQTELLIENVGQGVGLFVGFLILSGDGFASEGYTSAPSNLWPRKLARVVLPFHTVEGGAGIVWCADRSGNVHAWNAGHAYKRYRLRSFKKKTASQVFRDLYAEFDPSTVRYLRPIPWSEALSNA
ncbi:MAG TPA: hypothetical protein VFF79_01710 [Conexibacter sp.]|jgi:hypothetical protein|nr:hypothetical protein [Conexibacter sp.]